MRTEEGFAGQEHNTNPVARLRRALALKDGDIQIFILEANRAINTALRRLFPEIPGEGADREKALSGKIEERLRRDLTRLRLLRNSIEHDDYMPDEGDRDVTIGTLKKVLLLAGDDEIGKSRTAGEESARGDRATSKATSRKQRDWRAFQEAAKAHFERIFSVTLLAEAPLTLPDGQTHRFDFASRDGSILIECKSYTWTSGGNAPSAKLNQAKTDALALAATKATRKILVFEDDLHPVNGASLALLFARRNERWLQDVEVWRSLNGRFERIRNPAGR